MNQSTKQTNHSIYQAYYDIPAVIRHYKEYARLEPAEAAILSRVEHELADQPILDIGIGGGRTIPYLRALSKAYIGIDFSEEMVRAARQRFADANIFVADARDLSMFSSNQFAAAFFLGAGIDDINPTDRLLALQSINRVLKNCGLLILTTHNRDVRYLKSGLGQPLRLSTNPRVLMDDNLLRIRSFISHYSKRLLGLIKYQDYVICMDYEDCFADQPKTGIVLATYYISKDAQIRQLASNGFFEAIVINESGNAVAEEATDKGLYLHYIARKATATQDDDTAVS